MVTSSWSPDLVVGNIFEKILEYHDNSGKDVKYLGSLFTGSWSEDLINGNIGKKYEIFGKGVKYSLG